MKQIKGQISLSEYKHQNTPLGYIKDEDVSGFKGAMIPYDRLGDYIGKKVLYSMPRQSTTDYKVIIITSFRKDSENVYGKQDSCTTYDLIVDDKWHVIGKASRIGYTDDNKKHKENSWVSELFCINGRYAGRTHYQSCMYELT